MTEEVIIEALKGQYPRDLRKQIVKNIVSNEENDDSLALENSYKMLNQIFSYIIAELKWKIAVNSNRWDETPLNIMSQVFPKIETTKWFDEQKIKI
ncbi:MAG: hypothetical protein U9P38_07100 [Campylobacterota bacterium]|nr:hypothetical protein [Campylobacterota bacterium]